MADITNIRLTDFVQGLQEENALDYPPNAVRAGGNVTLTESIQTRGGISTVDSVGLPSGSEIMSIQQVKFPTNEKTFLIAQVHIPPGETEQYFEEEINLLEDYDMSFTLTGPTDSIKIGGAASGTAIITLVDLQVYLDETRIMNLEISESGVSDFRQGTATVVGSWSNLWNGLGMVINGTDYITFPDQVVADWFAGVSASTTFRVRFKLHFDYNGEDYCIADIRLLSSLGNNHFRLDLSADSENSEEGYSRVGIVEYGEIASGIGYPNTVLSDGVTLAFDLGVTLTYDEVIDGNRWRYHDLWTLNIGPDYADAPTPESWSLYAMPDTLPDTGA